MNNNLRSWIASSLAGGYTTEELQNTLVKSGFLPEEIKEELASATSYIELARKIKIEANNTQDILCRREALLKTLDYQLRYQPSYLNIQKSTLPPFGRFLQEYYYPNRAGVFSSALGNCEAKHWTPQNLVKKVGADTLVEVQYSQSNKGIKKQIKFGRFIHMLENGSMADNFWLTPDNSFVGDDVALSGLKKDIGDIADGYLIPEHPEGWMRILIEPKAITPLHYHFVNILLLQAYGRKVYRLVPSMQVPYIYNNTLARSDVDVMNPKPDIHPEFSNAAVIEVELEPGDCLFIPAGWGHHVTNLSASISISCTNINTVNNHYNTVTACQKAFD